MSVSSTPSEPRLLLRGITWDTYEHLRADLETSPATRLTYDGGDLEIMTTSHAHERWKKLLARMIEAMTLELGIEMKSGGQTTLKRRELAKGIEPDECYWVQNEAAVRGKDSLDLRIDPAPDLVVEAEVTHTLLDRLGILAALGVGEVWRYDGERLTVHVRDASGRFVESPQSRCFPFLPIAAFVGQLHRGRGRGETAWMQGFRQWVRDLPR